jgi:hypothetical protein
LYCILHTKAKGGADPFFGPAASRLMFPRFHRLAKAHKRAIESAVVTAGCFKPDTPAANALKRGLQKPANSSQPTANSKARPPYT